LDKFCNFADFKGIVEKEFKVPLDDVKRFERGCKVDGEIRNCLGGFKTNVEMEVEWWSQQQMLIEMALGYSEK
jgi:hypothetical protein